MSLPWHIAIHIFSSLLAGTVVFLFYRRYLFSFLPALGAGVAVDLDHLIDYFYAFGWNFRLDYFMRGYQFLKSDRIYIWFHAWEYVIILIIAAYLVKKRAAKAVFFSLALGLFFHLMADSVLNEGMKPQTYSLLYRAENGYKIERLVTPEHYKIHQENKKSVNF